MDYLEGRLALSGGDATGGRETLRRAVAGGLPEPMLQDALRLLEESSLDRQRR